MWGHWYPLFRISDDSAHEFQSQGMSVVRGISHRLCSCHLHAMIPRVISGCQDRASDPDRSPRSGNTCAKHCRFSCFSTLTKVTTNKNCTNVCYNSNLFKCLGWVTTFINAMKRTVYFSVLFKLCSIYFTC